MAEIPYPPVFHDWHPDRDLRVATSLRAGGPVIEFSDFGERPSVWQGVEVTEQDACLLAASLLERAGASKKLVGRVVREADKVG